MFTGIIEAIGEVLSFNRVGDKTEFWLKSPFTKELKLGESVCHDGVCLTVTGIKGDIYSVTTIDTTLAITNIDWQEGTQVNLERAMQMNGRLDGHIVQGHVDSIGEVKEINHSTGSVKISVDILPQFARNIVEKGSICMNGISLTIVNTYNYGFNVAIIPHTWQHTNLHRLQPGNNVNLEFDIIGKYVERILTFRNIPS
ncbi:MAG: riboflavin synthase [Saprospiraceae bacterium]|nr:riboflavin synthase [Saprospiraceae bacterium]